MTESDRQRAREIADELLAAPRGHVGDVLRARGASSSPQSTGEQPNGPNRALVVGGAVAVVVLLVVAIVAFVLTRQPNPVVAAGPSEDGATTSPQITPSVATSPSDTETSSPPPALDVDALIRRFYGDFAAAVRSGAAEELHPLLHPFVIEAYGSDACRAYLAGFTIEDFEAEVISVAASPEPWTWDATNASYDIPAAFAVDLEITQGGATAAIVGHVVVDGDRVQWFTRCDGAT